MKRFGLSLRSHKSEKGRRGPGSGGPWHPARVEYTQPMAGQMGYFTRIVYNNKIIEIRKADDKIKNLKILEMLKQIMLLLEVQYRGLRRGNY